MGKQVVFGGGEVKFLEVPEFQLELFAEHNGTWNSSGLCGRCSGLCSAASGRERWVAAK